MAYDDGLAERIRGALEDRSDVSERRMFGGLAFLVGGHMCVGVLQDKLMVRVGPEAYDRVLRERHVRKMDFTGTPLKGFVYVLPTGYGSDAGLHKWIDAGLAFATSLPPKAPGGPSRAPAKGKKRASAATPRRPVART
jgi:hypothetical protein